MQIRITLAAEKLGTEVLIPLKGGVSLPNPAHVSSESLRIQVEKNGLKVWCNVASPLTTSGKLCWTTNDGALHYSSYPVQSISTTVRLPVDLALAYRVESKRLIIYVGMKFKEFELLWMVVGKEICFIEARHISGTRLRYGEEITMVGQQIMDVVYSLLPIFRHLRMIDSAVTASEAISENENDAGPSLEEWHWKVSVPLGDSLPNTSQLYLHTIYRFRP